MGSFIPIKSPALVLSRGWGIRNAVNLIGMRAALDRLVPINIGGFTLPLATLVVIALLCVFITWFKKTKLGQDMRAIGQDMAVAESAGINVMRTRLIAIMMSTVMACYGQIIYLQKYWHN
jgi:simple sugar transport system permease protein